MATWYIDYENGDDSNGGTSWSDAWKSLEMATTANGVSPGDTVKIAKSPDPVSIGDATWTDNSDTVTLASAKTAEIDNCETAWTPAANVTQYNETTNRKQGSYSRELRVASGHTGGRIAYKTFSAKDLSAYSKICCWIRPNGEIAANRLSIRLYQDSSLTTEDCRITIPFKLKKDKWHPISLEIDGGGNIGSNIEAVELYAEADIGSVYIWIDHIFAANDLTLTSLISKNTANEPWFTINTIEGTTVKLGRVLDNGTKTRKYGGTTETVTTYVREPIRLDDSDLSSSPVFAIDVSGSSGNLVHFVGGYNTTTDSRDGYTFFDGINASVDCISINSKTYLKFSYIGLCRFNYGMTWLYADNCELEKYYSASSVNGFRIRYSDNTKADDVYSFADSNSVNIYNDSNDLNWNNIKVVDCTTYALRHKGMGGSISNVTLLSYAGSYGVCFDVSKGGVTLNGLSCRNCKVNLYLNVAKWCRFINVDIDNSSGNGIRIDRGWNNYFKNVDINTVGDNGILLDGSTNAHGCCDNYFEDVTIANAGDYAVRAIVAYNNKFSNLVTSGSGIAAIRAENAEVLLEYPSLSESTEFSVASDNSVPDRCCIRSSHHNQVEGAHKAQYMRLTVESEDSIYRTSAPSIKFTPTVNGRFHTIEPFLIPVDANVEITITVWSRWDSSTPLEASEKPRLVVRGCGVSGQDQNTSASGVWEQLTVTLTPSRKGTLECFLEVQKGTDDTTIYFDDLEWTTT